MITIQYNREENIGEVLDFFDIFGNRNNSIKYNSEDNEYYLITPTENIKLCKGDYIIKDSNNNFHLYKSNTMDFSNTFDAFDEFAKFYSIKDSDQVYTNGCEMIPVFRVKQWLEHFKFLIDSSIGK